MLDLDFAAQVMAKLQVRFRRSCILLAFVMLVVGITAGVWYYLFQKSFNALRPQLAAATSEATYQEIGEVRATIVNLARAYRRSGEKAKFKEIAPSVAALERDITLLRNAGERSILDGQKMLNQLDDLAVYITNARRVVLVLVVLGLVGFGLIFWRTWRRFQWNLQYYQSLYERQAMAEEAVAAVGRGPEDLREEFSAMAAQDEVAAAPAALPPLPEVSAGAEDEFDLAKVLMKGVRRLRHQQQAFVGEHVAHLDLPASATSLGPLYLRKAVRFKTPLAVLITDPADLPQAQQVMNYSATGILIRIPHQATLWPRPGQMIQGRVGTAEKFAVFSGTVVRVEQRPQGDLIGVRFVTAPW